MMTINGITNKKIRKFHKINRQLVEPIIIKLNEFLDYDMNEHGIIVASSDHPQVDQIHEEGIQVISKREPLVISLGC